MCGIVAAFTESTALEGAIRHAMDRMVRRGPDAEGLWQEGGIYLGHRRLAILDLDERANQPMISSDERYAIVFNGEIYNFRDLRKDLERQGVTFRTTSDTEVILALFAREGEAMLSRLKGMFAFVIWDRQTKRGFAARDAYGIKPLYIASTPGGVLLGSQVKALLATKLVSREPDPIGQSGFWMLGSVPEPRTWYRDIKAMPAGHYAWIKQSRISPTVCWHDLGQAWRAADAAPAVESDIAARVRYSLLESVSRHLVSDVPVGVFLSGGIDSGAMAGLMREAGAQRIEGITITYDEYAGRNEDEVPLAARIAETYGIRHHVRRVTREEFHADLPRILNAMDQPSIDGINTWYASKAAAEAGLKVVLSGIGGDELFQGYSSFATLPRLVSWWTTMSRVPGARVMASAATGVQARRSRNARWKHAPDWANSIAGAWWLRRSVSAPEDLYDLMPDDLADAALRDFDVNLSVEAMTGPLPGNMMLAVGQIESMTYLRNQLLRDSDWASMDHSVELRTPLVDLSLLTNLQGVLLAFGQFPAKVLLAEAPATPLPQAVMAKQKTGFSIPVDEWIDDMVGDKRANRTREWAKALVRAYEDEAA
jgi:asparagine synthase (glutamine-hydrolysing)